MAYLKFNYKTLTQSPERINVISTKFGTEAEKFSDADLLKPVKLNPLGNGSFILCEEGDELEGWVDNIDAGGTEDGLSFGGAACGVRGFRVKAKLSGAGKVNDLVVAGAPTAVGTKLDGNLPVVKVGEPVLHRYRIMAVATNEANAVDGDTVVLELL